MIRVLLGFALPAVGLGLAAAFVGPTLVATSSVDPIVVAAAEPAAELQPASFDQSACASTLLFGGWAHQAGADPALRIVALAPRSGSHDGDLILREIPLGNSTEGAVVLLLVDADGRILAALNQDELSGRCDEDGATAEPVGAI